MMSSMIAKFSFISLDYSEIGLPVLDPLFIKKIDIEQGNGPVVLNLNINNARIEGYSGLRFRSIQGLGKNLDKAKVEFKYYQPIFQLTGNYKASGKVLVFPVQGDGRANITLCEFFPLITRSILETFSLTTADIDIGIFLFICFNLFLSLLRRWKWVACENADKESGR